MLKLRYLSGKILFLQSELRRERSRTVETNYKCRYISAVVHRIKSLKLSKMDPLQVIFLNCLTMLEAAKSQITMYACC